MSTAEQLFDAVTAVNVVATSAVAGCCDQRQPACAAHVQPAGRHMTAEVTSADMPCARTAPAAS
jgi:hypothetical protein